MSDVALRALATPEPVSPPTPVSITSYLDDCRRLVLEEISALTPPARHGGRLYELMREYPLRGGKALRPALCIATCRALGGYLDAVLHSAAAIELYHNAFLVHDDVEDGSELRRAEPTLHRKYGVAIAVNVGDGMLALSMSALLDNTARIGVGRTLRILDIVSRMARESAEGQMMELDWVAGGDWTLEDRHYLRMVYKKTTWYSFIAPVRVGAVAAGATDRVAAAFTTFATLLGIAFQIQDDVLNLAGADAYGKEIAGDLWEGKHTLILVEAMRRATVAERAEAVRILARPRPSLIGPATTAVKSRDEVAFLRELVDRYDALEYASGVAARHASRAKAVFARLASPLPASTHVEFLAQLVDFVIRRTS
jgi:geranylgeranyl diphosphate synthase type II